MSLRFIYGRAGTGKTYYCLNSIKQSLHKKEDKKLVLLVPEQYTLQAERDLIAVLQTGGILETEVLSFRRMAYRVLNEVGGITYPHMHSAGKCMMIYRILDKMRDEFTIFNKSADSQGFVKNMSSLITEFKRYNVYPEKFETAIKELDQESYLAKKLSEIKLLYAAFENAITTRYRDTDDELSILAKKLDQTGMYDGAEIWIDGFAGFTPQEFQVIAKLVQKAAQVNISMCTDVLIDEGQADVTDVFGSAKKSYKKFVQMAVEKNVEIIPPVGLTGVTPPRFRNSAELINLEQNYFSYPYKCFNQSTTDIELFESVNLYAEIEECARDIIRQSRDHGLRYKDISVVTRNLTGYKDLVEVIFNEYNIPCFVDAKSDIADHPLIRLVTAMLDIFIENWSYETVFRYLKSGLTGIERSGIDRIENYVLACGIRGNRWIQSQDWTMNPELVEDDKADLESAQNLLFINEIRRQIVQPLINFRNRTKGRKKAADFCTSLYDFLLEIGVESRIEQYINQFRQNGNLRLANEYEQVWNILMEVFDQIVEVMGEETLGIERFANTLKIGLGEYEISSIPASLDQVLIGSVEHSRSHEIQALYVLGVNDGVFPASGMTEGILSDNDRQILNKAGIDLASDTKTQVFDEQYLIYRVLTTPQKFLRLSWPIADHEGRTMRPSAIISRVRKLFPQIRQKSNLIKPKGNVQNTEQLAAPIPAFNQLISALRSKKEGQGIPELWQEVYRWFCSHEGWEQMCTTLNNSLNYKNIVRPVSREKIRELYGSNVYSTVSRIEKYTACPFAYYIQYGLHAKERKIYQLTPPDVGTFMHSVIERFSKRIEEQNLSWRKLEKEWCRDQVAVIVDTMLDGMKNSILGGSKRFRALTLRLKRVVTRAVWLIAEHIRLSEFEPIGYEVDFGEGGQYPPIVIELDSGEKVRLVGRIDRIDALNTEEGTFLRIVDYKSGDKDFNLSDVYYGLQMQLITYLDALWENSGQRNGDRIFPGGMLYFKVDDPIIKATNDLSAEEIETAIRKKLKMKGLLLADVKLIKSMDNTIEGSSTIIPARINKGDVLGKSSAATIEQFTILREYVKKLLKQLCSEIIQGKVPIKPYKKKKITSCQYCSYSAVCQFDVMQKENTFNILHDRQEDELWKLMSGNQQD